MDEAEERLIREKKNRAAALDDWGGCSVFLDILQEDTRYIKTLVLWLSDSSGLSDNAKTIYALVVRFFGVIGQLEEHI